MDDLSELKAAREKVAELEAKMAQEVRQRMELLGMGDQKSSPKQKRTRRTKAQIDADNARQAAE